MVGIVADDLNSNAMHDSILDFAPSSTFTVSFALALIAGVLLKVWLTVRQIRYVAQHRNQVPSAFQSSITLSNHQKAADYTTVKAEIGLLELTLGSTVLLAWTLLGGLSALNVTLLQWLGGGMRQEIALLASFVLINGLIDLPLNLYQTFVIEERFGFNKMTIRLWIIDLIKSCAVGVIIGLPIVALVLWLMAAAGDRWWLMAWGVWSGFNLLLLLIYPSYIAPLFNKFLPLKDEILKARVTALMQRCGFTAKGLFVMDGSKRSAHSNAYFTGFGMAKRVVFYDTLLAKLSADEVDAVLAHELGHFKHGHIIKRIVSMLALSLIGFASLGWLGARLWFYQGLGVQPNLDAPNDGLALLLFLLVTPVFSFFMAPVLSIFSRKHEFEADAYAVAQTSGMNLASALLKLYQDNASTLTPDPAYVKFYYSHPPATERLARIMV